MEKEVFDSWAIVELFGHQRIAGKVTEQAIGGGSFLRVDVPECSGQAAFTKFYGAAAIYAITPTSEELARAALRQIQPEPVSIWIPELHTPAALPPAGPDMDPHCPDCGFVHSDQEDCPDEDIPI